MENCEIEIATLTDGKTELFQTRGRFTCMDENYCVRYQQEGDAVSLEFNRSAFQMKRSGESGLSCVFRHGERTAIRLSSFGGAGEIPVQTSLYSVEQTARGCLVTLHYDLIFSKNIQTFQLKLKIETSEEK